MKEVTFTRKELYDLVWSEPLIRLAKKYKISDNGLRKICKRMNIPLPNSGHWQKIQNGYKVQVHILPVKYNGDNMIKLTLRNDDGSYVEPETSQRSLLKQEILNNPKLPMKVNERLSNPDPLVIQAQKTLLFGTTRKGHHFKGVIETNSGELNIRVAPSNVSRTLRFMDAFIKLLRVRGHDVYSKYGKNKGVIYDVVGLGAFSGTSLITDTLEFLESNNKQYLAICTLPFKNEGRSRNEYAKEKMMDLQKYNVRFFDNNKILEKYGESRISKNFDNSDEEIYCIFEKELPRLKS